MRRDEYEHIKAAIGFGEKGFVTRQPHEVLEHLAHTLPRTVKYDTLLSIYSQSYQAQTRSQFHVHRQPTSIEAYRHRFEAGEDLLVLAEDIDLAPCLLARLMLKEVLGMRPKQITEAMRAPELIPPIHSRLRDQVTRCIEEDEHYSPFIETVRFVSGIEWEHILYEKLHSLGLSFETEEDLRRKGHAKTPDVRLLVPVAVCGRIIHWIDSKAMFGDDYSFRRCDEQISSYVHRYGSGMIVFWFDFVEDLQESCPDVLLFNGFPDVDQFETVGSTAPATYTSNDGPQFHEI